MRWGQADGSRAWFQAGVMSRSDHLPDHVRGLCQLLAQKAGQPVQLHETHISWVIVSGQDAYKLRKRIKLPFADFSTLEARRDDCLKELALNRRWAPDLYRGVVEVRGSDQTPELGGSGALIDFAVHMRRLADHSLLKHRIEASQVEPSDMCLLAHAIADVHQAAPVLAENETGALRGLVATSLRSLLDQLLQQPMHRADVQVLTSARAWVEAQLARCAKWLQARVDGGFVRDCHGDLHLENVVWMNDGWLLFDGIEFDDRLRTVDVISDLAFLTMDLKVHGREDLAFALLDAYLEQTGDHEGVKLMGLYEVQRALVRLLVASLPGSRCEPILAKAYLKFVALSVQAPSEKRAHLVLMHGLSGSGKSVLSGDIAMWLPAIRARSDVERKRLFGMQALSNSAELGQSIYTEQANQLTTSRLLQCAQWALEGGWSFVADATFLRRAERDRFWQLAEKLGCGVSIVHCEVDMDGLRRRVRERAVGGRDASEASVRVLLHQLSVVEPLSQTELACAMTVCTEHRVSLAGVAAICFGIRGAVIGRQRQV